MARIETQSSGLKTEDEFFDSEASMDQQDFEMSDCPFNDVFNSRDSPMDQINTFLKNVQVLLEAASYIETAERKDGSKFNLGEVFIVFWRVVNVDENKFRCQ